jgi:hypothetical protein
MMKALFSATGTHSKSYTQQRHSAQVQTDFVIRRKVLQLDVAAGGNQARS